MADEENNEPKSAADLKDPALCVWWYRAHWHWTWGWLYIVWQRTARPI